MQIESTKKLGHGRVLVMSHEGQCCILDFGQALPPGYKISVIDLPVEAFSKSVHETEPFECVSMPVIPAKLHTQFTLSSGKIATHTFSA